MADNSADSELFELIAFLGDATRKDVQQMALDIVAGLTASQEGINRLKPAAEPLLTRLFRLLPDRELSRMALSALVNLAQDDEARAAMQKLRAVPRVMDAIREKSCQHLHLLTMLLANLTVDEAACEDLLQLGTPGMEGLNMAMLLKLFITSAVTLEAPQPTAAAGPAAASTTTPAPAAGGLASAVSDADPCQHLGAVITNVTRLKRGREMMLEPGRGLLQALASQLAPGSSEGRRRGCSAALRNCFMSAEADGTLEQVMSDEAVLARMLEPISGGERSDKDDNVREALAEAVAVLAAEPSGRGRDALLAVDADKKLHSGYEYEEHPGVCAAMEAAGRCLIKFGDDDGGDVDGGGLAGGATTVITEEAS